MLEIIIPESEMYHPGNNQFIDIPACTLTLEHSLISIAKWEARWHIPYLNAVNARDMVQTLDYIRCMSISPIKDITVLSNLSSDHFHQIQAYIDDPMTATTFSKSKQSRSKEVVTAEVIYARMFSHNIPMECQKWHLNRLLTLLKVCDVKDTAPTKMPKQQTAQYYAEQNALRRAKHNSKG